MYLISIIYTYARGGRAISVSIITPNIIQEDLIGKFFIINVPSEYQQPESCKYFLLHLVCNSQ